jgi:autotransporter-associated beta strand protein
MKKIVALIVLTATVVAQAVTYTWTGAEAAGNYHSLSDNMNKTTQWAADVPVSGSAGDFVFSGANLTGRMRISPRNNLTGLTMNSALFTMDTPVYNDPALGGVGTAYGFSLWQGALNLSGDVTVTSGSHEFLTGITLLQDSTWDVASGAAMNLGSIATGGYGITKTGAGTLTINNANTFTGDVNVNAGILGGAGSLDGGLNFAAGAQLSFDADLALAGEATFADFDMADIVGLDSSVDEGIYTLITGNVNFANVGNVGVENAFDLGDGKSAYFQEGSLEVVVVPEPATIGLLGLGTLIALLTRYFRR